MNAPGGVPFATHLGNLIRAQLKATGLLDPNSNVVISGKLTKTELDPAMVTASGALSGQFVVTRANVVTYDREVAINHSWESSIVGAGAIPMAAREFENMYRMLIAKLFADPDFQKALAKQ